MALALTLLPFGTAGASGPASDPYAIFARARNYFQTQSQAYPEYLRYDVAVHVVEGGKDKVERYNSVYDATTNDIWVDPVSDYEREHPPSGSGVNLGFLFWRVGKPQPPTDFLGVPMLSPTYSFGISKFAPTKGAHRPTDAELVEAIRKQFHDPNPRAKVLATPTPSGLLEIADVTVYKREYVISLAGEDSIEGHNCYHLKLQPVRDGGKYRLRDVWVDEATFATERLNESINFVNGPGTSVPWTVNFTDINGLHYVRDERADAPMEYRGLTYTSASIQFENIVATDGIPRRFDVPLTNDLVMDEPVY